MRDILAVSSSPRRGGNSELLLQSFTAGAEDNGARVNLVRVNDLKFRPCQACDLCNNTGSCVVKDDMQQIYPLVASASAMVLATPVYFGTLSAQLKMFIDRFQCFWHAKYNLNKPAVSLEEGKPGFFICVGALAKEKYCEDALAVAKVFFHNINYHYDGCLCFRGVDAKGAVRDHPGALQEAYEAGRRFVVK